MHFACYIQRERRLLCGAVHCESLSLTLLNFQKVTNIVKCMGPSGVVYLIFTCTHLYVSEEQRGWCLRLKQMQSRAPALAEMQRNSERRDTTVGVGELRTSLAQSQQGAAPVGFWLTTFCHTVVSVILNSVCSILLYPNQLTTAATHPDTWNLFRN